MHTHEFTGRRWSIISQKPFDAVVAEVEAKIGRPNIAEFVGRMTAAASYEDMKNVVQGSVSEIGLMEFMRLDQRRGARQSRSRWKPEERAPDYRQPAHHAINGQACPGCRVLCASDGTH